MKPAISKSLANNDERKIPRRARCGAAWSEVRTALLIIHGLVAVALLGAR